MRRTSFHLAMRSNVKDQAELKTDAATNARPRPEELGHPVPGNGEAIEPEATHNITNSAEHTGDRMWGPPAHRGRARKPFLPQGTSVPVTPIGDDRHEPGIERVDDEQRASRQEDQRPVLAGQKPVHEPRHSKWKAEFKHPQLGAKMLMKRLLPFASLASNRRPLVTGLACGDLGVEHLPGATVNATPVRKLMDRSGLRSGRQSDRGEQESLHALRSRLHQPRAGNPETPRQPVRPEVVTYVLGTKCHPCVRA